MSTWEIVTDDCLVAMRKMDAQSVDAIITDPPYFRVKEHAWDRQWRDECAFLEWIESLTVEWQRILKPNGTLYCFASPRMAAQVECVIAKRFRVLNSIVWLKPTGPHLRQHRPHLRTFCPQTERIVMAEQLGGDGVAKDASGYDRACQRVRAEVFEPIRQYLDAERERAGFTRSMIDQAWKEWKGGRKGGMASHWFGTSQWALPTRENYEWLQRLFNRREALQLLKQPYEVLRDDFDALPKNYEHLRTEYDELKEQFESLRRPFALEHEDQYTDVWTFAPVQHYQGKHPCEKPLELMLHIVKSSTRLGDLILDCFCGSGATGLAAIKAGRQFLGIERDVGYSTKAIDRLNSSKSSVK